MFGIVTSKSLQWNVRQYLPPAAFENLLSETVRKICLESHKTSPTNMVKLKETQDFRLLILRNN